jgi:hypothetical protein
MDVRWLAYIGSGVLAVASFVPATWHRAPDAASPSATDGRPPAAAARSDYERLIEVEQSVAGLRRHQYDAPAPRLPARNPFRFGLARRPAPARSEFPPSAAAPEATLVPPPPESPALRLVGIVERRANDGLQYTAVLAGAGDVHLASAGDRIGDRFTVVSVGADAAEVRDEQIGETMRLVLGRVP